MWWLPLWVALFIWMGADQDVLEPPWQWGRIIAISVCVVVATLIYLADSIRGDE